MGTILATLIPYLNVYSMQLPWLGPCFILQAHQLPDKNIAMVTGRHLDTHPTDPIRMSFIRPERKTNDGGSGRDVHGSTAIPVNPSA